ncbi:hypothetical protein QUF07_02315 [Lentilactobacillus sp. TOM.63]|uniref:hypothetical protein n=1 Tax=Lentilactobacillus sp. TOM.63 TaxID=3055077 RepID=UPI0025A2A529|nr:hypothetical protein [Lentilactobacillus sp. TOM.63]MDM7515539.1 hypothetical protein [Lentilactobacillus sp. TOM.63]
MMHKYLVTFENLSDDDNNELSVAIRGKLEDNSGRWLQIFPNQIAIKTDASLKQLVKVLDPEINKTRMSIVEFSNAYSNEARSKSLLTDFGF